MYFYLTLQKKKVLLFKKTKPILKFYKVIIFYRINVHAYVGGVQKELVYRHSV